MADIPKVSMATFETEVLRSDKPVLVDFTAIWCGPCKMLDPILGQLTIEWEGKVKFLKVDVDENPQLAVNFNVMGVPTLILFKNGEPVERVTGYLPKDRLEKRLQGHLQ